MNVSFAGTTSGIFFLAFVVDIVVWYKAGSISFAEEQEGEIGTAEEMATLKSQDAEAVENDYLWRFRITLLRWRAATATLSSSSSKDAAQCRRICGGIVLHEWCQNSSSCFPETANDRLVGDYTHQDRTFLEGVPFWWAGSLVPLVLRRYPSIKKRTSREPQKDWSRRTTRPILIRWLGGPRLTISFVYAINEKEN